MCQSDWATGCSDTWLSVICGCVCKGMCRRDERLNWWIEGRGWHSPLWVGLIQSTDELKRTQRWREGGFTFPLSRSWTINLLTPVLLVLRPSDSAWIYTTGFPGSPARWWQMVRHLSLHNCVSQYFVEKSLPNICTYILLTYILYIESHIYLYISYIFFGLFLWRMLIRYFKKSKSMQNIYEEQNVNLSGKVKNQ